MCGLTGFVDPTASRPRDELQFVVRSMASALAHRGPDDAGEFVDEAAGVAFGFRRLSIIDLSPAGHQPMTSATGRYVMMFNGEVYNFAAIRRELEESGCAPPFRGYSDSEVMLAAIEAWGVSHAVKRFIGMFAIAFWDRQEKRLTLVRDRVGVKPLYYGWAGRTLVFGSELKAIARHPQFTAEIDRDALALYMRYVYVPSPYSIYRGIRKVEPGSIITFDGTFAQATSEEHYWSAREVAERGFGAPHRGDEAEIVRELDVLLRDAVALRMVADVPLGVFLSGGVDSSLVVALMSAQSSRPVRSFSIGFEEQSYDEARYAAAVARHLGTDHTELYVTADAAMCVIPRLPTIFDEPFADSSQIPTYLVASLARRHVTVSLSGDGGDELFGGYNRYVAGARAAHVVNRLNPRLRRIVAAALLKPTAQTWDTTNRALRPLLPPSLRHAHLGHKLHKAARLLRSGDASAMYEQLVSHWEGVVPEARELEHTVRNRSAWPLLDGDVAARMMYVDLVTYLVDDILVKVDRTSMAVSLEAREPLLDHRLIEYAWRIPMKMKIAEDRGKVILRRVLRQYVPDSLIERPKMGFGVPLSEWLRGPLRDWAEELLSERSLGETGLFDPQPIRNAWSEHLAGGGSWQHHLWAVLMFEGWRRA